MAEENAQSAAGEGSKPQDSFDYQLDRHCSKTGLAISSHRSKFDYQLDRHCSKTLVIVGIGVKRLITS